MTAETSRGPKLATLKQRAASSTFLLSIPGSNARGPFEGFLIASRRRYEDSAKKIDALRYEETIGDAFDKIFMRALRISSIRSVIFFSATVPPHMRNFLAIVATLNLLTTTSAVAQDGTFQTKALTPETALAAARAALESCRKQGFQVAVAVVDRAGLTQVLLRDRFAGAHTVEVASNKAWTAASFRTSTSDLAVETQPGKPMSGLRTLPRFLAAGGGLVIQAGGSFFGAIGVSGAPGGDADDRCADAGIKAIADAIDV